MSRLIDADVLSDQMYHEAFETDTEMQRWDGGCWIRYKMFENALCNAPTIEERKTGRWEEIHIDVANDDKGRSYRFYSCTACGVTSIPAMLGMKKKWLHFCPNCGAKMEVGT